MFYLFIRTLRHSLLDDGTWQGKLMCFTVYLMKTCHFTGLSGDKFRFDANGDGPARYNIIHFKQISPGTYQWVTVGQYIEGELHLNDSGNVSLYRCS